MNKEKILRRFIYILSFVFAFVLNGYSQSATSLPNVTLEDTQGNSFSVGASKGKPTMLVFWATWCNCTRVLDQLNEVYSTWHSSYGLDIYSVSIDDNRSLSQVKPFVEQRNWDFVNLVDDKDKLKSTLKVTNPPHILLFDKEGNLVWQQLGHSSELIRNISDELEKMKR